MLTDTEATTLFERRLGAWLCEDTEGYLAFWAEIRCRPLHRSTQS